MPNIRAQRIDADGIYIQASDGREFSLTRAEAIAHFQSEPGTRLQRLAATIQWAKDSIEAALGPEQVPSALLDLDVDDIRGFRHLGIRARGDL